MPVEILENASYSIVSWPVYGCRPKTDQGEAGQIRSQGYPPGEWVFQACPQEVRISAQALRLTAATANSPSMAY